MSFEREIRRRCRLPLIDDMFTVILGTLHDQIGNDTVRIGE